MKCRAILFDTRSIQRYIYSGNMLKTNIGASYIVENVFKDILVGEILKGTAESPGLYYGRVDDTVPYKEVPEWEDEKIDCKVAYIGGGNALILFKADESTEKLKKVVQCFTRELLTRYPGLSTGSAIGMIETSGDAYMETRQKLYKTLKENQNAVYPLLNPPYTGLTQLCHADGEKANCFLAGGAGNSRYVSQETAAKIKNEAKASERLQERFQSVIGKHIFPKQAENLGQIEGESYFAIVHVDGNNMGKKFTGSKDLESYSEMSRAVVKKTELAFTALLEECMEMIREAGGEYWVPVYEDKNREKLYLPIRPLILGGDDVTFVCAGRWALQLTHRFMQLMKGPSGDETVDKNLPDGIDCCGGIAILPLKYPFFRGYELAEELCGAAKKLSREKPGSSWLDFAVLHGEQGIDLGDIRRQEYTGRLIPNMHFGPYEVDSKDNPADIQNLKDELELLFGAVRDKKLARGKLKELRFVMQETEIEIQNYQLQMARLNNAIPMTEAWKEYEDSLWALNGEGTAVTPLVDVIEMMDFYLPGVK